MLRHLGVIFETHYFFPHKIPIISFCHFPILMQFPSKAFATDGSQISRHPVHLCRLCTVKIILENLQKDMKQE